MKNGLIAVSIVVLALGSMAAAVQVEVLADSVGDYAMVQGHRNWFYGYYDGDGVVPYRSGDFETLGYIDGAIWRLGPSGDDYWTRLYHNGGHPTLHV